MNTPSDRAREAVAAVLANAIRELQGLGKRASEASTQEAAKNAVKALNQLIESL